MTCESRWLVLLPKMHRKKRKADTLGPAPASIASSNFCVDAIKNKTTSHVSKQKNRSVRTRIIKPSSFNFLFFISFSFQANNGRLVIKVRFKSVYRSPFPVP